MLCREWSGRDFNNLHLTLCATLIGVRLSARQVEDLNNGRFQVWLLGMYWNDVILNA